MVIWSLQVAIRGTVSLTAYKTQLKNTRHRLNEAPRRRVLQMLALMGVTSCSWAIFMGSVLVCSFLTTMSIRMFG